MGFRTKALYSDHGPSRLIFLLRLLGYLQGKLQPEFTSYLLFYSSAVWPEKIPVERPEKPKKQDERERAIQKNQPTKTIRNNIAHHTETEKQTSC